MAYLLGRGTAVEWLRKNRDTALLQERFALPCTGLEGSRTRLTRHEDYLEGLTRPLQLIVWSRENRRPSAVATCHAMTTASGDYPAIRIKQGLFCSTPEFTFLQMASILDDECLRFLGMELCGRFGIADGKLFLRPQTCTPQMLLIESQNQKRMRGRRRALATAPLVHGGAASPMEIALSLILCEPIEHGGFGLQWPELNHTLPVSGRAREMWEDDHITPDLLWEKGKVIIEYDSDLHHSGLSRIARDAKRRDVLVELGYRVITVASEHMSRPPELERIAGIIASCLGEMPPSVSPDTRTRQIAFQGRIRGIATSHEALLAIPTPVKQPQREWHVRKR